MHVPMRLSFGTYTRRPSGWLKLTCRSNGTDLDGFGEGATLPEPLFTDDSGRNIATNIVTICHALGTKKLRDLQANADFVYAFRFTDEGRYPTARLAVEMALIDAAAKAREVSVQQGARIAQRVTAVPYGKSIGGATVVEIFREASVALDNNAKKIKLKLGPATNSIVVRAIRNIRTNHPTVDIMVDANGGFDPLSPTHLRIIQELDDLGLLMIEEPVSRVGELRGLAAVRTLRDALPKLQTPLCLDDCLTDYQACEDAIAEGLADIINIKPGRIGSFLRSLELVRLAARRDVEVMVGGMLEATPGRCMTAVLAAFCLDQGFTVPGDISLPQERLADDLVSSDKQLSLTADGMIQLPSGPGWGF